MSQSNVLEKVERDIQKHGWHVLSVFGDDLPSFSYTVGFHETLSHAEILISGLSTNLMHQLLNDIGELVKDGQRFSDGDTSNDIIKGFPVKFVTVRKANVQEYFRAANAYYGEDEFEALQCIWPDKHARFPNESTECQEILA